VNAHAAHLVAQGSQLLARGDAAGAARLLRQAVDTDPADATVHAHLAMARAAAGDPVGAEEALSAALRLRPDFAEAAAMLGMLLSARQRAAEAEPHLRQAFELAPGRADVVYALTRMLAETGRAPEAVAILRASLRQSPSDLLLQGKLCMMLNYTAEPPELVYREHARFGDLAGAAASPAMFSPAGEDPDRRLRIGYLSPDLREHSVAYYLEPLIEHRDRATHQAFAYPLAPGDAHTTPRLRALFDGWHDAFQASDDQLAAMLRRDRNDILVELAGHTSGNRLAAMARRLAPVQVTFVGYPNTTGVRAIDYRLVDGVTDPPGSESFATERLVRLPGCFLCYRPPAAAPAPAPPPSAEGAPITFGSFNSLAKLSDATVALWSRVLHAVPGSRLVLKGKALGEAIAADRFRARFAAHQVAPDRLELLSHMEGVAGHLGAYARVDIALDAFPYGGTTTTCEALWMGVPVVTLAGRVHASRVGASLLTGLGLTDLIADSQDAFVAAAAGLAREPARLAALRSALRPRLLGSPLCDAPAYARKVEAAFRQMWRTFCTST
jgi:predicted O-linked N-acetylglucosamine transferase (SPINDLY family)